MKTVVPPLLPQPTHQTTPYLSSDTVNNVDNNVDNVERILPQLAIERYLTEFVRWALHVTRSGECSGDAAIGLLDQAWTAQKLLWSLRDQQNSLPIIH